MNKMKLPTSITPLVINEDVLVTLKKIPEKSINLIITSPPYWNLRDYDVCNQIGQEKNVDEYVDKIYEISKELKRVLTDDGSYFLNIGDSYFNTDLQLVPFKVATKLKEDWKLRNIIIWHKPNHMPSSVQNRFTNTWEPILFFIKNEKIRRYYFDLDQIRTKHKTINTKKNQLPRTFSIEDFKKLRNKLNLKDKPEINKNYNGKFKNTSKKNYGASPGARTVTSGEYYSLQRKFEIDDDLKFDIINYLREKRKEKNISIQSIDKIFNYKDTAGHWFRTDISGSSLPKTEDWYKLKKVLGLDKRYDEIMTEQHYVLQSVCNHPKGKNPGDFWSIPTERLKDTHFAIFPEELPKRIIKACCPKNGIVLDPFAGSGTTGKAAKELGVRSILIEINKEYIDIIKKRCKVNNKSILDYRK
jgi:DNA modification methylase